MENLAEALNYVSHRCRSAAMRRWCRRCCAAKSISPPPAVWTIRPQPAIRPLAIFSDKRHPAYPDLPTVKELGVATSVPPGHNGLFAPRGLVGGRAQRARARLRDDPEAGLVLKVMANTGQTIEYLDGAAFHAQTVADYKSKGELIKRLGLGVQ